MAQDAPLPPAAAGAAKHEGQERTAAEACGSVVMRDCSARMAPGPVNSVVRKSDAGPAQWQRAREQEAIQEPGILVEANRAHDEATQEVFDRYLQAHPGAMTTRRMRSGQLCTTIVSTGLTLCSPPGSTPMGAGPPRTDFSDGVF